MPLAWQNDRNDHSWSGGEKGNRGGEGSVRRNVFRAAYFRGERANLGNVRDGKEFAVSAEHEGNFFTEVRTEQGTGRYARYRLPLRALVDHLQLVHFSFGD